MDVSVALAAAYSRLNGCCVPQGLIDTPAPEGTGEKEFADAP